MMTKTAKALEEYDNLELPKDIVKMSLKEIEKYDEKLEELRKAVAIAFAEETPNSVETCLQVIYPGPPIPQRGYELSFVRRMVEMSKTSDMKWNPRFVEYARVEDRTPEEQLEHDRKKYPGGCMTGFSLWIRKKWSKWYDLVQKKYPGMEQLRWLNNHEEFDKWLQKEKS